MPAPAQVAAHLRWSPRHDVGPALAPEVAAGKIEHMAHAAPFPMLSSHLSAMMGDAPFCDVCGHITVRNGACYKCLNCGNSMGCS